MVQKRKTILAEFKMWSVEKARVFLVVFQRYCVKYKKLLKKRQKVIARKASLEVISLTQFIKKKKRIIERKYQRHEAKVKDSYSLYKKALKYSSQGKYLGISFFNKQKKVIFSEFETKKKILKEHLFLYLFSFKKEKNKIKNKLNKQIKKYLIKNKKLFVEIYSDEKQVFINLFNSIGDNTLDFFNSLEKYQKQMHKLFIKSVFRKIPRSVILARNKAKKALFSFIREYKKLSKKYACDCQKILRISNKYLLKQKVLTVRFINKKTRIINHEFNKYERKLIKEKIKIEKEIKKQNKKIFLKQKRKVLKIYRSLTDRVRYGRELLLFTFRNISLKLFKFKTDFKLFKIRFQRIIVYARRRTKERIALVFKEYFQTYKFSFSSLIKKKNLISIEPLLLFLMTSALLFAIIPISFLLVKKELPVSNQALIASTSKQILTNNSSEDLKEKPETNISASVGDSMFSNLDPKEEKNAGVGYGVLAININKSVFLPNDIVYFQMAVLDEQRYDTVCDADLILTIITPSSKVIYPTIEKSGDCGLNNVTDKPDYFAHYQVNETGIYQISLRSLDNNYEITDFFEVRNWVAFDVERVGPTRIYPPADYEVSLKIKANQDFKGKIIEKVPISFDVRPQDTNYEVQETESGEKTLIWQDVVLRQNEELTLKYIFNAPNVSPYLYSLGPLVFQEFRVLNFGFQEIRQWHIIADAIGLENTAITVDFDAQNPTIALTVTNADMVVVQVMTKDGTVVTDVSDVTDGSYVFAGYSGDSSDPPR
ncbi:MAG: hypothetical protein KJI70_02455, partial [Patescibacteria group bacterium]|nr:hypothetical protein [Patescibacteria group bacterium]